jgi:hypothetical protein
VAAALGFLLVGLLPAVHALVQFVTAGGTPMPIAPTQRLVVNGFNRYVRNPGRGVSRRTPINRRVSVILP